jgi:hypothetical protein
MSISVDNSASDPTSGKFPACRASHANGIRASARIACNPNAIAGNPISMDDIPPSVRRVDCCDVSSDIIRRMMAAI